MAIELILFQLLRDNSFFRGKQCLDYNLQLNFGPSNTNPASDGFCVWHVKYVFGFDSASAVDEYAFDLASDVVEHLFSVEEKKASTL